MPQKATERPTPEKESSKPARRSWWHRVPIVLLLLAVSGLIFAVTIVNTSTGRGWLFSILAQRLERETGIQARVGSSRLSVLDGRIVLSEVQVQSSVRERPFVTAAEVAATFDWRALLARPIRLRQVVVFDAVADTTMLPRDSGESKGPPGSFPLVVDDLRWESGAVGPWEGGTRYGSWFERMGISRIDGEGRLENGILHVVGCSGVIEFQHPDRPTIEADIDANGRVELDGTIREAHGTVLGDGLQAEMTLTGADPRNFTIEGSLDARLGTLFPDLTMTGTANARGSLAWTDERFRGQGNAVLTQLPAELLAPLMQGALSEIELVGKHLEGDGNYLLDLPLSRMGDAERDREIVELELDGKLMRGSETLLEARLEAATTASTTHPVSVRWNARLLPAYADRCVSRGSIRLPAWDRTQGALLEKVVIDADFADLGRAAERFGLLDTRVNALRPVGRFAVEVRADGPLNKPNLRGDLRWVRDGHPLLEVTAKSDDLTRVIGLTGVVLGAEPGRREWRTEIRPDAENGWAKTRLVGGRASILLPDPYGAGEQFSSIHAALLPQEPTPAWVDLLLSADPALGGELTFELAVEGLLTRPAVDAELVWQPGENETLFVEAVGEVELESIELSEFHRLDAEARNLSLRRLAALLPSDLSGRVRGGKVDASLHASGPVTRPQANLVLHGKAVDFEGLPAATRLSVNLSAVSDAWIVHDLVAEWTDPSFGSLQAAATVEPSYPIRQFSARVLQVGLRGVGERASMEFEFEDGVLRVTSGSVETASGQLGTFTMVLPMIQDFGIRPLASAEGETSLWLDRVDVGAVAALWLHGEAAPEIAGTISGSLDFDLTNIASARGKAKLDGFRFKLAEEKIDTVGPLEFSYGDGTLTLAPGRLLAASSSISGVAPLDISGTAAFDSEWSVGSPLTAALRDVAGTVSGTVNASLLAPILGATGTGPVELYLKGSGRPGDFSIEGTMRGERARFLLSDPYPTRIENFDVAIRSRGSKIRLERATAEINGGTGKVGGVIDTDGGMELNGSFRGVRYRLGFGVTTWLDADIRLDWPAAGRRLLSGDAVVDRALMNRDINLDREILLAIFDPVLDTGTNSLLSTVDLDLTILTDQGLVIRNNLAELRADWSRFDVRGTLADPSLTGVAVVAPGGRLHLLGETLRIDEASLSWNSSPVADPVISLQTTSSREDPTIGQSWRSGWYTTDLGPGQGGTLGFWSTATASTESSLGASLATYTQDRLYGSLGQVLNRTELSYEPLPLFGETDTEARFTLAQELSKNLSFVASTNPREAEGQTYILDLHNFRGLPSMRAQVFTGDNETHGMTLQQTIVLGGAGGGAERSDTPTVRRRSFDLPGIESRRAIKRAARFHRGQPFPSGAELDVEVDVDEAMLQAGYPDAQVVVLTEDVGDNQIDLTVSVDPGVPVQFVFEKAKSLPRSVRRRIIAAYHSGGEEPRALKDMRAIAERSLRAAGCFETVVEVESTEPRSDEVRRIRIKGACAREANPGPPIFIGLPAEVGEWVAAGFGSRLSRIELAAGIRDADDHLARTLLSLGYARVRVADRRLSDDGTRLQVFVEPGPRAYVAEVVLENADEVTLANAKGLLAIRNGDPLRRDWIAASKRALEADLRRRGFDEATVRVVIRQLPDDSNRSRVVFNVETGRPSQVQQVKFEGLQHSNPAWVSKLAALTTDGVLQREDIANARGRLYRTGVFERIRATVESLEDDDTDTQQTAAEPFEASGPRPVAVAFELDEAPRYRLSYGGRWESDVGLGGVIDLVNRNTLGRGHRTGVRAILNSDVRSLRLYHLIPQPLRSERSNLELFVEGKREQVEDVRSETVEAWAQLTFPLTDRVQTRVYTAVGTRNILSGVPDPELALQERVISPRFGWQLAYTTVQQNLTNQRRKGIFLGIDLSGSHAGLGSALTTFGAFAQFKVYAPFGPINSGRFSWHQSYRAGTLTAREQPIPFVDRLRLGGEFSVRGYPTNGIGPLDADGTPLGGELMFVANQEVHARLWDSVFGVLFFDAGNVWNVPGEIEFDLFRSAGIGARYTSPVGPLRIDVGFPLDRRNGEDRYQVYVGFGSVF